MLPITQSTDTEQVNSSLSKMNRGLKLYNSKTKDIAVKAYLIQDYYLDVSRLVNQCLKATQALTDYVSNYTTEEQQ